MKGNRRVIPAGSPPSDGDSAVGNASTDAAASSNEPEQADRYLPIANVSRIMKRSLPASAKISKEAKETVQECVSEFISFVTGEASDKCRREKRKTVNGDDLLWAMTTLGFDNYVGPLKAYLNAYMPDRTDGGAKSYSVPPPAYNSTVSGPVSAVSGGGFYPVPLPAAPQGFGGGVVFDARMGNNKMSGRPVEFMDCNGSTYVLT